MPETMEKTAESESLLLTFSDGTDLFLNREQIERATARYWDEPGKIPPQVRAAIDFQRCAKCPMANDEKICDALRPILPLLDHLERFDSTDPVQVVYLGAEPGVSTVAHTTMPTALSYVSLMSLIHYCQAGRKYRRYYLGITPLFSPAAVANRLYLNIYWLHRGDPVEVKRVTEEFGRRMLSLSQNQVKRLNLICQNDVFKNAFVNAHVATALLSMNMEHELGAAFEAFEQGS